MTTRLGGASLALRLLAEHKVATLRELLAMLATRFAITENTGRNWPLLSGAVASPREARRTLATYFTTMVSALLQPSAQELDVYQDAARLPERERRSQLTVAGRRFRFIRVETSLAPCPSRPAGWEWLRSRWWGSPLVWTRRSKTAVLAVLGYRIVSYGLPLLPGALACLRLQVNPTGGEEPKAPEERGVAPVNR